MENETEDIDRQGFQPFAVVGLFHATDFYVESAFHTLSSACFKVDLTDQCLAGFGRVAGFHESFAGQKSFVSKIEQVKNIP
jgi:hypothetical protein